MFSKLFSKKSFDNYVKDELEEILSSLNRLMDQKEALGLVRAGTGRSNYSGVTPAERFRVTPVAHESRFFGREDFKEKIIQSLRSAEVGRDKVSVIPVIGAGGIGKTTLVQIIYDHPEVKQLFGEVRAWITVSTEFVLQAIAKKIIKKVSSSSQIDGDVDQQEVLFKLRDALKGKKFLLVLDDVWSEDLDEWDNLKSCLESGERGSKIIVTTRSSKVASIAASNQPLHSLPELPEEDCRRLFAKTVFNSDQDRDAYPDLREIGQKIVEKCRGLPLSVKSMGGILHRERDPKKWESILTSSVWELLQENSKNIIPSLWLSYRYLPSEIKPCFAYCSIFPKDYLFEMEELVRLWMAEGFLKNEAGKRGITMEEVGKRYFEELISRSLFQSSKDRFRGDCFIMHDLVHDLAMYVSGKFCFWLDEDKILPGLACETRHLSYNLAIKDVKKFEGLSKVKRLHSFVGLLSSTLIMENTELDILKVLEEVSVEGSYLRVLSLSGKYKIDSLPDSVGKLKHLRYLNLSTTVVRELPHYVGTLYNLQTLRLSGCHKLTRLPESIGNLKHMRYLDLFNSAVRELPHSVGTLYNLRTLRLSDCGNLSQLPESIGNLKHLTYLNLSQSGVRELPHSVGTLYNLQTLLLSSCRNLTQLPESIGNLKHLRYLDLSDGAVRELPHSVGTLYNLQTLLLSSCLYLTQLPESIGKLKHLRYLTLSNNAIRELPHFVGTLYNLQTLLLSSCRNLTQLPESIGNLKHLRYLDLSNSAFRELPHSVGTLYNLQTLLLSNCKNLSRLPSNLGNLINLHHLGTSDTPLEEMPQKMCNLKKLHTLTDFVLGKQSGSSIKDLGMLENLHGSIRVSGLQNVNNVDDALKANLKNKKNLSVLALEWEGQSDERDSRHEEKVLEALQPHTSLKELTISKYEGTSFPDWDDRDNELKVLSIKECSKLEFLGNIHYESLEYLRIEQCEALKSISLDYLPKLNRFYLRNCQNFESFRFAEEPPLVLESLRCLDLAGLPKFVSFPEGGLPAPNLEDFFIYECENLRSLPQQMQRLLPSNLESLHIWGCKKLAAQVMHWDLQTLTPCLREFWIDGCGKELLDSFPPEGLLPTSLTSLAIKGFPHLKTLNIHAFQQLEGLTVVSCDELQCLPEESLPNSLFRLCIERCPLLERRYRKETGEGWHKISHILIVVIN